MSLLGQVSVTRRRFAAPTRDAEAGYSSKPTPTTTTLQASVQVMFADDLKNIEGAQRHRQGIKLYIAGSGQLLRELNQHANTPADEVIYDGVTYRVIKAESDHPLIPHTKAWAVRIPEGEDYS